MPDLSNYRSQFDSLDHCHYLISNSLGAMPKRSREYTQQYLDTWSQLGARAWSKDWWMLPRQVGDKVAALMGAAPDTVTMQPNVTSAEAIILSCFDFDPPRNKVVMVDMEFPSILYIYREWLKDRGTLEVIPCPNGVTIDTERVIDAIDETTLLVPISHVLFRSAYIVDARAIIEKAHAVGAMVVLDIFQSLGTVPLDVSALNVDFAVGGCLKWLCGGPGACFLYVRPDLQNKMNPRFTGWLSHSNPFLFDTGNIERTKGSYRFLNGTPVIPALYSCQAGLDIVAEISVEKIRARSMEMTARLIKGAESHGWPTTTPSDPAHRAGTIAINIAHGSEIAAELNTRNFLVDYRPKAGIRISPHFYNTDSELDDVISEISKITDEKSYEKHLDSKRIVT